MKKLLLAAVALAMVDPAFAVQHPDNPLVAALADVPADLDAQSPRFVCYDPTDKNSCQQVRWVETSHGRYRTHDFSDGEHILCFSPNNQYAVCTEGLPDFNMWGEILVNDHWEITPAADPRCTTWGGQFDAEYLACVAALPPKLEK
jgi:hypothetical protein